MSNHKAERTKLGEETLVALILITPIAHKIHMKKEKHALDCKIAFDCKAAGDKPQQAGHKVKEPHAKINFPFTNS